jgi:hypothetical protein
MGDELHRGEFLTTWKEIAAYLKTSIRTCVRWEANSGLPIHRQEGAPKSRVYAYKHELDSWFGTKLGNGSISLEAKQNRLLLPKNSLVLIALFLVAVGGGMLFFLKTRSRVSAKPAAAGVPQSSGAFNLEPGDIIESEFAAAGVMRVWRERRTNDYFEVWRIEPVRHTSFVAGNIDDSPGIEVIAPGYCREMYGSGGRTATRIRFFLNAYKINFKDWWKTTYYDRAQCIFEQYDFEFTEISIGNIDEHPGNEIVLATAHSLSVFRYDPKAEQIRLICMKEFSLDHANPLLRSLCLADIDDDGVKEILATANEGEEGDIIENRAWLFVLKLTGDHLQVQKEIPLSGNTSTHALQIGSLIPGGKKEVVFPLYKKEKDLWYTSIVGWNPDAGFVFERAVDDQGSEHESTIYLDVGDLDPGHSGDAIVVARQDPNELLSYSWDKSMLVAGPKYRLDHRIRVNGLQIGGYRRDPKGISSVLIYGIKESDGQQGRFYLERVIYAGGFLPGWLRVGGERMELPVSFAAYAFDDQE